LRFSGSHDPIAALVLCGAHHADRVMVACRCPVVNGFPDHVDIHDLRTKHTGIVKRLIA
jgi:8-oxoguanine deaminase